MRERTMWIRMDMASMAITVFAITLLAITLLLGTTTRFVFGDEPTLPDKTAGASFPPYAPYGREKPDDQRAWADAMRALGRQHPHSDAGGNVLISAADLLDRYLREHEASLADYREAFATYPAGHPYAGVALLRIARVQQRTGNLDGAEETLRQLGRWRMRAAPDARPPTEHKRQKAAEILAIEGRTVQRLVHEGMGRFGEAAAVAEAAVRANDPLTFGWQTVARLYARAGMWEDALRAMDAALPLARNDKDRGYIRMWQVYAEGQLIDDRGAMGQPTTWPGDEWFQKALARLDELSGNPRGVGYAAQLGSHLSMMKPPRYAEAIQAYDRGLRHPGVGAYVAKNGNGAFLMAVEAARKLGRFDEANRLLARVRLIGGDTNLTDDVDIGIRTSEEAAAIAAERAREAEAARKRAQVEAEEAKLADAREGAPARIVPSSGPEARNDGPVDPGSSDSTDATLPFGPLLIGLLLLLGLSVVLARRR